MNLKNTIDNTNKHTNDLKLAKQKINDRILSGGGTIANTISAVPEAIDRMLKQNYKKMAHIEHRDNYSIMPDETLNVEIKTNTNFTPSKIIISFIDSTFTNNFIFLNIFNWWDNNYRIAFNYFQINLVSMTKEKIVLDFVPNGNIEYSGFGFTLEEIYLIE